jgi:hypothetical protein
MIGSFQSETRHESWWIAPRRSPDRVRLAPFREVRARVPEKSLDEVAAFADSIE